MRKPLAACFGCAGLSLNDEERDFFRTADPLGFILFARNVNTPDQVRELVNDLRASVGRDSAPVLIDQEGGKVQRLTQPHWRNTPPPSKFAALHDRDPEAGLEAARLNARLIADDLYALGIDVDCLPVLDIPAPDSHPFLHDRVAGKTVEQSILLGHMVCDGLIAGGVLPVIKHIPGHGRGKVDSHEGLPQVTASRAEMNETDFAPFRALADSPWAMTAHIVYTDIDPDLPATLSETVINDIIRSDIGYDGFLVSDDIGMGALGEFGSPGQLAADCVKAGCDAVLHCNGDIAEMRDIANRLGALSDTSEMRFEKTLANKQPPEPLSRPEADERLAALLRPVSESA